MRAFSRDVRTFLLLAKELELQVLMRIGPWDHGECRNGGLSKRAGTSLCTFLYTQNIHKRQVHFQSLD